MRINKINYFLKLANDIALRSTCLRHNVGAIIVRDGVILSTGYNGAPRGFPHCTSCIRDHKNIESGKESEYCYAVHAEANAIINAARNGINIYDGELYCTHAPCSNCLKMIINSGIKIVYAQHEYKDEIRDKILAMSPIKIIICD